MNRKSLDFMLPNAPPSPAPGQNVTGAWVEQNLSQLLTQPKSDNEIIFSWIEQNVPEASRRRPEFIRALMTAVCRTAVRGRKVNVEVIQNRRPLLRKYLQSSKECELQALFALQALVHSMQHPIGVLRDFFDILYDEELISEEAFLQWERSDNPQEQEGKGVALKQVVQFFAWLQEADDDPATKS